MRMAEINGCQLCRDWRSGGARGRRDDRPHRAGRVARPLPTAARRPDEEFYAAVSRWRDHPGYSERERLAIGYAEYMSLDPQGLARDEEFWARLHAVYARRRDRGPVLLRLLLVPGPGLARARRGRRLCPRRPESAQPRRHRRQLGRQEAGRRRARDPLADGVGEHAEVLDLELDAVAGPQVAGSGHALAQRLADRSSRRPCRCPARRPAAAGRRTTRARPSPARSGTSWRCSTRPRSRR